MFSTHVLFIVSYIYSIATYNLYTAHYISWTRFCKMNMRCQLSAEALRQLLSIFRHTKSRKLRAMQIYRKSKGNSRRYRVDRKAPNARRDRWLVLQKIARMSDAFFKRYFRMDRATFRSLLETISPQITRNAEKASNSSGSPIHPSIRLAIALRFLSGGSYLDLAFGFDVSHTSIMTYVWEAYEGNHLPIIKLFLFWTMFI